MQAALYDCSIKLAMLDGSASIFWRFPPVNWDSSILSASVLWLQAGASWTGSALT